MVKDKSLSLWWPTVQISVMAIAIYWATFSDKFSPSARVSAVGGVFAVLGAFVTARPILRIGLFGGIQRLVKVAAYSDGLDFLIDEKSKLTVERLQDKEEQLLDYVAIIRGTMFVALGTALSSFSGLIPS